MNAISVAEYDRKLAASMSEAELQTNVEQMMGALGWLSYHTHDSRRSNAGFPDLVAVKRGRLLFAELKRQSKNPEPEQVIWLEALRATQIEDFEGALPEVYVWKPSDWLSGEIERVLT